MRGASHKRARGPGHGGRRLSGRSVLQALRSGRRQLNLANMGRRRRNCKPYSHSDSLAPLGILRTWRPEMQGWRGEVRVGGVPCGGRAASPYSPLRKVPCLSTEVSALPGHRRARSRVRGGDAWRGVPAATSDFRGLLPIIHKWPGTLLTKGIAPREGAPALLRRGIESGGGDSVARTAPAMARPKQRWQRG